MTADKAYLQVMRECVRHTNEAGESRTQNDSTQGVPSGGEDGMARRMNVIQNRVREEDEN